MKVTLNWLKQYVDFTWTPEELSERLTMLGLEVEGVQKRAGDFEGIVVAQVITRDKHPNADKLSVCRVHDGTGERQIVCGAQNFQAGDKVPMILPGATLPPKPGDTQPFVIKVGKIRSVESHGMLCSAEELGIDPESIGHRREDGLLILRADAAPGQSLAEYLDRPGADVVYDLEITPNRPDLNSVIGIAREIAALTGNLLRVPAAELPSQGGIAVSDLVAVRMEATDLCPRYTARVLRGVKVGPSPDWLRSRLEQIGLRSINNVVDVTNFVMIETGQPLHAFDYHLVGSSEAGIPTVIVRRAVAGESFTTLDETVRSLSDSMLLIADPQKGIALAGIMGGQNTEIQASTQDVLLESAWFHPTHVRRTSKLLGLRTDASYRFERGADIGVAEYASRRAAALILELAGGTVAEGVVDAYPTPPVPREIVLRHRRVREVLGIELRPEEIEYHLQQLGLTVASRKPRPVADEQEPEPVTFRIPSFRVDLKREIDLIEEVARLHGVDRIPSTPPRGALGQHPYDAVHDVLMEVRRLLAGMGLCEAQGQTLVNDTAARWVTPQVVALANPLSSDMNVLRPSLLPGLLDTLRHNLSHRSGDVQLFELGRVFTATDAGPKEGWRLAIALTGARAPAFWAGADRDARCDLYDLKGILEEFLELFGLRGVAYGRRAEPDALFLESATVALGGKLELGQLGQVQPALAKRHDLRDPVLLAELNLDLLLARRNPARSFKPLPAFPSTSRDVAMIVPETTTHEAVLVAVRQAKPANLESVDLFDVFRGRHVPEGQKSVAYSFTYRGADRTLKDEEVNAAHQRVVEAFKNVLQATVRE